VDAQYGIGRTSGVLDMHGVGKRSSGVLHAKGFRNGRLSLVTTPKITVLKQEVVFVCISVAALLQSPIVCTIISPLTAFLNGMVL